MTDDIEILAGPGVAASDLADLESEMRRWGREPVVRRLPARRGGTEWAWLVVLTIPAEVVARAMLEHLGADAYAGLRRLVARVLRRAPGPGRPPATAAAGVLVESSDTGAQFALEADLPPEAYRQLFDEIARGLPAGGTRVFDRDHLRWVPSSPPAAGGGS